MTEIPEHLRRRAESARLAAASGGTLTARDVQAASLPLHLQEAIVGKGGMLPEDPRPCIIVGGTNIYSPVGPFDNQKVAHAYYQLNQPTKQPYLAPPLLKPIVSPTEETLERAREMVKEEDKD